MPDESIIWLIYGLGFGTGVMLLVPILYFLVKNRLRKDWVWAITRGRDGRFRIRETKPDKGNLHFKDESYAIDANYVSTFKRGLLQSARSAWLYAAGDPRPVKFNQERVPELDKDGKPTGAMVLVTNAQPMFKPASVWQTEIGSHIVSEALGRSKTALMLLIIALMLVVVVVIQLASLAK